MSKPLIAIAANFEEFDDRPKITINRAYVEFVARGGGIPFLVLPTWDETLRLDKDALTEQVRRADGLLLPGGMDVCPWLYGQDAAPHVKELNPDLDEFQMSCFEAAKGVMPVLGICRGEQLLNVALGGTLIQHLPNRPDTLEHSQESQPWVVHHAVTAEPGSHVAACLGERFLVNSFHHQAVDQPGKGLTVTARAADGVIEAIEGEQNGFPIWGLQWHPEGMTLQGRNAFMTEIIKAFIETCRR